MKRACVGFDITMRRQSGGLITLIRVGSSRSRERPVSAATTGDHPARTGTMGPIFDTGALRPSQGLANQDFAGPRVLTGEMPPLVASYEHQMTLIYHQDKPAPPHWNTYLHSHQGRPHKKPYDLGHRKRKPSDQGRPHQTPADKRLNYQRRESALAADAVIREGTLSCTRYIDRIEHPRGQRRRRMLSGSRCR
jgi:hypothetical protein